MAWLSGWDKRIKLTVDHTKIDADLSWFPITVILSSTHGSCVFDELTSDANRFKIAFTKVDGTTELYAEIEEWDDANESAIIHVSKDGWTISSSADTDFYMYYDIDHADNTTYIGDIDSTPGHNVWDGNFKLVTHMVDDTTSTIKDSTSNGNDGTKYAANEPIEADGQVGKAQHFDGSNDLVSLPSIKPVQDITVEAIALAEDGQQSNYDKVIDWENDSYGWQIFFTPTSGYGHRFQIVTTSGTTQINNGEPTTDVFFHLALTYDGTTVRAYVNGTEVDNATTTGDIDYDSVSNLELGNRGSDARHLKGKIDETRISDTARSAAWMKATYDTLWDTLLTYGSEESAPTTFIPQVIMF